MAIPVWNEKHLRAATQSAGVALWSWNVDNDDITMDERAYDLWEVSKGALLGDLISILLAPYEEKDASVRVRVSVPRLNVGEASSTALALVIHELATNSAKYGALSVPAGTLDVSCNADGDDVAITWTERGGPSGALPGTLEGFGTKLVQRSMSTQLGGTIAFDWSVEGLVATMRMSKVRLVN